MTNVANWINSGLYLTTPSSFLNFYYRGLCQIAYHFNRQVPTTARLQIDYHKMAQCLSLVDQDGGVHYPRPWQLHPGSTQQSSEFGCTRKEAVQLWDNHKASMSRFIPYVVHSQRKQKSKCP